MKKRLFIAINPAPELQTQLGYLIDQLRDFPELKPVAKDQLHLTLIFLEDVDDQRIPELADILDALPKTPFTLEVDPPTFFSTNSQLQAANSFHGIWMPIRDNPDLNQLANDLRDKVKSAGFVIDYKPFSAHITLTRSKTDRASSQLQQWTADWADYQFPVSPVNTITLYSSQLTPTGPVHTPESNVKF